MLATEVKNDVYWLGVLDPDLRIFDIIMTTEYGTTYNAYLVKGRQKTVLIEAVKEKFFDIYLQSLQELVDLSDIDYLIMNHTEPDHAGTVDKLLEKIPGLTVMGSQTALKFLKEICNQNFPSRELAHGDSLDLGGKTLHFISAPFLHWPDTMFTYLAEDKILFPCDFFGSHYPDERVFNDLIEKDYTDTTRYYYDMILSPFRPYVLEGLDKIKDLDIEIICPGHGPVIRKDLQRYFDLYREWAGPETLKEKPKIVMAYVSAYGYTRMLSESIAEGIETIGDFDLRRYDLVETPVSEVMAEIADADGLLLGSCTINGDALPPIWEILVNLSPVTNAGMVAAAFGSYGWSGEAVPNIEARLNSLRMKVLPGLRVNFKPSPRNLEEAFTLGMDFARAVAEKGKEPGQKRWRCLVCGHIHQGANPPEICPACGVGAENFVEMAAEDEFRNDTQDSFVIVGGGVAGLSAARAVRERNATCSITMVSEEADLPYYRPALSDLLGEELPDQRLFIFDASWYEKQAIQVKSGCRAESLNTRDKTVVLSDGNVLPYSKLILATGARSNLPPFPGVNLPGVFALRSLADARRLKEAMGQGKKAVVIGGGVLGLEAVWEMLGAGMQVTVVEHAPRLMPRQLDEGSSARLADLIKSHGVSLLLGRDVDKIEGEAELTGVRLLDGQILEADLVLLSTGVRPNVELAVAAGLDVKQGIIVDASMRTSVADIYAAGDVAQYGERLIGLWPVSMEMGRVAGAAATGDWAQYAEPLLSTLLAAFDREIFSLGDVNISPEECRIVEINDPAQGYFKRSFLKDGVLVGEIIIAPRVDASESMRKLGRDQSGKKRHNKWKCRICGYVHEGPEPPDECPVCGAPKDTFDPID